MPSTKPVIIVDDDPEERVLIKEAFIENKWNVNYLLMENGNQLMSYLHESAESQLPALILLNLKMPIKNGKEALKEIREDHHFDQVPVVVFTTSTMPGEKQDSYNLGANCFITKPNSYKQLLNLTNSMATLWL
jgi:CheY-like chemotaxis protein